MANVSNTVAGLVKSFQKDYGEGVVTVGGVLVNPERIPTGIFEFDLATGGGFPRGCASIIYGMESSGKTVLTLKAIASNQAINPDEVNVFIDMEHSLDLTWARTLGVDTDKLVVLHPDYAEQTADMIEGLLQSEDVGLVVLDSVAALCTVAEAEKSAEKKQFGGSGAVMGVLTHKSGLAFRQQAKKGRQPALIYITQTRTKMGLVFGDPEPFSGGNAIKFQSQMTVRLSGKNVMIEKISKTMPVIKETSFTIKKWKVAVTAVHGKYALITIPHDGWKAGELNDLDTLEAVLKSYSYMVKVKGGWQVSGSDDVFPNRAALHNMFRTNKTLADKLRKSLIDMAVKTGPLLETENEDE
jgi:recombination protein RecA